MVSTRTTKWLETWDKEHSHKWKETSTGFYPTVDDTPVSTVTESVKTILSLEFIINGKQLSV